MTAVRTRYMNPLNRNRSFCGHPQLIENNAFFAAQQMLKSGAKRLNRNRKVSR